MPAEQSVPYLEAEAFVAAWKILDKRDTAHPLFRYFPREGYVATKIKVQTIKRKAGQVRHTTWGGKAVPVSRGQMDERDYSPAVIKLFETLTIEDMDLYAAAAAAKESKTPGPMDKAYIATANNRTMALTKNLREDDAEEFHRLMVGALLGSVSYRLEGTGDITVDYGLTEIDSPSTLWDNIGATLVEDIGIAKRVFRDSNTDGSSANAVFYNPKAYEEYFLGNTQLQALLKLHPQYAVGLAGLQDGKTIVDGEERLVNLFGLTWIPVEGSYRNLDGQVVDRWPKNKLVLCRIGSDGMQSELSMALSQFHTPKKEPHIEIHVGGKDVKTAEVYLFDDGVPTFKSPDKVMPWTIGA